MICSGMAHFALCGSSVDIGKERGK